jgi:glycosyltransferase involved in cell wall biosynthesis
VEGTDRPERTGRDPVRRGTILAFGLYDWDTYWQTRQQVLSRLAKRGWRVGYTTPAMSVWERQGLRWRDSAWRSRAIDRDSVRIRYPGRIPTLLHRSDSWDRWVVRRHARLFAAAMAQRGDERSIAYVFHPSFLPYVEGLRSCRVVYHADDRFTGMPGSTTGLADLERALCERADRIFAVTPGVSAALGKAASGKTLIVPNGADAEAYGRARASAVPAQLAAIPRPRVAYAGSLNEKIDFALIARLARARPAIHWLLIGLVGTDRHLSAGTRAALGECSRLANVHFLGEKDYRDLPAYCAHVDANAMFYRTDGDGWWRDIYPLKLHECLSTGRPLLSSDTAAVREFARVVAICTTDAEWLEAVDAAVAGHATSSEGERIAVARANTWERRVDEIETALDQLAPMN